MIAPFIVDDDDILRSCRVLGLPDTAFSGEDGADPRREVLRSNETLDIEACPGSGKTTLLVAKLAILARKWKLRRSGICVLSHTNAARREIERCLGQTREGASLLSYPHFVGTIHAFVNEFLAMPWLRSLGYPITVVDDAYCEQHRRHLLTLNCYRTLRTHVAHKEQEPHANYVGSWHVISPDFAVRKDTGAQLFRNPNVPSAQQLRALAKQCTEDGFYRYDEMFTWAEDLLNKHPDIVPTIRERFPMLFIDEVQDNSEPQSKLLQHVFVEGNNPVIRQRYGDSNQAIYGYVQATGAESDPFPVDDICRRDIANSYRFGQQIADLADPLGLQPQNLQGIGPPTHTVQSDTTSQHTVFLFNEDTITSVLDAYATRLLDVFSEDELRAGSFTAVGAVHRPGPDNELPRFVGHYWPEYDHELSYSDPKPNTFHQYISSGWNSVGDGGDIHVVVERVADAIIRAAKITNPALRVSNRIRKHRYLLELLDEVLELKARYIDLVMRFIDDDRDISTPEWQETWVPVIIRLAGMVGEVDINPVDLNDFLVWPAELPLQDEARSARRRGNYYRYPALAPRVNIRVGTIHSVKGETHTATLVLDTFFYGHHFRALTPWLTGERYGLNGERVRVRSRLKQHYVAFTRPTHLLCLAMRDDLTAEQIQSLKDRSWRIGRVENCGAIGWL